MSRAGWLYRRPPVQYTQIPGMRRYFHGKSTKTFPWKYTSSYCATRYRWPLRHRLTVLAALLDCPRHVYWTDTCFGTALSEPRSAWLVCGRPASVAVSFAVLTALLAVLPFGLHAALHAVLWIGTRFGMSIRRIYGGECDEICNILYCNGKNTCRHRTSSASVVCAPWWCFLLITSSCHGGVFY